MLIVSLFRALRTYLRFRSNLGALSRLDDRTLRDIGMDRSQLMGRAWEIAGN